MLALLPQTTFFKMQVRDDKIGTEIPPEVRTELDLSFSKLERMVMDYVNASSDSDDTPSHETFDCWWQCLTLYG